jgi:hypothetical protein
VCGVTIRPYKPRDSARSALLTAVRLCLLRGEEKSEDQPRRGLYSKASQPAFYSKASQPAFYSKAGQPAFYSKAGQPSIARPASLLKQGQLAFYSKAGQPAFYL